MGFWCAQKVVFIAIFKVLDIVHQALSKHKIANKGKTFHVIIVDRSDYMKGP